MFWIIILELIWIPILIKLIIKFGFVRTWIGCIVGMAAFACFMSILISLRGCR